MCCLTSLPPVPNHQNPHKERRKPTSWSPSDHMCIVSNAHPHKKVEGERKPTEIAISRWSVVAWNGGEELKGHVTIG